MAVTTSTSIKQRTGFPWWVGALVIPIGFVATIVVWGQITKALGWRQYNYDTETAQAMAAGIPVGAVLLALMVWLWRWSGWTLQGPKIRWDKAVWWTLGIYLGLGVLTFITASSGGASPDIRLLVSVLIASIFIGLNEELAFRGFSVNGFARRLPVFWAVVAAAVIFGLCHSTNIFSGSAPGKVAIQVVLTTFMGLMFGWLYIFSGRNLLLVALVHAIHDFFVVAPTTFAGASDDSASALDSLFAWAHSTVGGIISATIPLVITYYGWQKYKGYTLEQALGLAPAPVTDEAKETSEGAVT